MQERDSRDMSKSKVGLSRRTLVKGAAAGAAAAAVSRGPLIKAQENVELRWSMWSASAEELAVWKTSPTT